MPEGNVAGETQTYISLDRRVTIDFHDDAVDESSQCNTNDGGNPSEKGEEGLFDYISRKGGSLTRYIETDLIEILASLGGQVLPTLWIGRCF